MKLKTKKKKKKARKKRIRLEGVSRKEIEGERKIKENRRGEKITERGGVEVESMRQNKNLAEIQKEKNKKKMDEKRKMGKIRERIKNMGNNIVRDVQVVLCTKYKCWQNEIIW